MNRLAVFFIIISVVMGVFGGIRGYCFNFLSEYVVFDLRIDLFENFIN